MDKIKKYIIILVILISVSCAGYYFVCGAMLYLYYQDVRLALGEFVKGIIATLVYLSLLYYFHISKGTSDESEHKICTKRDA